MKAIRVHQFGGPEELRLEDVPNPQPGPGHVVVRIRAAGVNPVDTYIRSGNYGARPLPYTPGSDAAGIIVAVGEGVKSLVLGDRVFTAGTVSGAYAEMALCEESRVVHLPNCLSFSQGAGIFVPYATAYRALYFRAHAVPGEIVLVHGATGGVGTAAVQIAHAAGLTVIGTGGSDEGRNMVKEQGADYVLDHHDPACLERIMEITAGKGVDVILEMLANLNLGKDLPLLARGGRVVVIGSRGRVEIDPRDTMGRDASIMGMLLANATENELHTILAALFAGFSNGTLSPVVGKEIPLAEAPSAHIAAAAPGRYGKIVLTA